MRLEKVAEIVQRKGATVILKTASEERHRRQDQQPNGKEKKRDNADPIPKAVL
jgi:hypothetical protein